jgi:preprotein translocase subunit SecY
MSATDHNSVPRAFAISTAYLLGVLPSAIIGLGGIIAAAQATGFDNLKPQLHEKLTRFTNALLEFAIEHWLLYIIVCVALGFFWALFVAEPKRVSKRRFQNRRSKRIGK